MDVATCVPLRSWPLHCPQVSDSVRVFTSIGRRYDRKGQSLMYILGCPTSRDAVSTTRYVFSHAETLGSCCSVVPPPDAGQDEVLDLCLRRRRDACPPPPASPPPPPPLSPQEQQELVFSPILGAHNKGARPTRPFKAYPKNPLSMAATESLLGYGSSEAYLQFRRRMLEQLQASSGGGASRPAGAARAPGSPLQQPSGKSAAYWERRRKNNEAAKRSRDARRAKEDELAIRAAFLEQENLKLRYEVTALRTETSKLRYLLFNGTDRPAQPQQQQQQQQVDLSLSSRWTCRTSPASQQPLIDLAFSNNR
ncbi:hepatic leukemia factor-like [Bacillus rossius redtenbacheri]|uniref:hepatic leukemia factor-like n=1 Tax=Bacillus rossius redtenbacheri TaxID=93214 RepID=UPI002FDCBEF5